MKQRNFLFSVSKHNVTVFGTVYSFTMNLTLDHRTPACPVLGLSGRVMPGPLS
jgi:hypothetical protein